MKHESIAVFGSAFNPPHRGHEDVIEQILLYFSRVILVPSFSHAFGKEMMPFSMRVQMIEAMVKQINDNSRIEVCDIEKTIFESKPDGSPVYTYDVLMWLQTQLKTDNLTFVIGPDNAEPKTWRRFYRADEITTRWSTWIAKERLPIRSSIIRKELQKGVLPSSDQCCDEVIDILAQQLKKT